MRLPRKLKKKLKAVRIKHFEALLKNKGLTFEEFINMDKEAFKRRVLEWHKTHDKMSDNIKPMTDSQK